MKHRITLLSLWLFAAAACSRGDADAVAEPAAPPASQADYPEGRLDDSAVPLAYRLQLTILPDTARFSGSVAIDVDLRKPAGHIFLHGDGLNVTRSAVRTQAGETLGVRYTQVSDDGVARVDFSNELAAQTLTLEFDFDGPFDRLLNGLYRVDEDGHSYAFTQFESTFGRKAFVSFDEPAHKTPFDVTLRVRDGHVAVANTEVVERKSAGDGLVDWVFATTERLPTYLVAFAVGELDVVQGPDIPPNEVRKRPVPLRGVAAHGKGAKLSHALATTGEILTSLERYFDVPYPYSKLDIIAVPDFQAGAMENAGAITFRERLLLLGDDAPVTQLQAYYSVMAHELAHMWFGDLVTMPWWDDIWLNESFATWMSYKAVADVDPESRPDLRRLSRLRRAKKEDALLSARQIRESVLDHDGIDAAFDGITYAKGGAVLNMFENYLGEARFRDGVRGHIKRFAWGSADVNDFIASLVAASEPRIKPAFESFLFQNGLPKVSIEGACEGGALTLAQSRYLPLGAHSEQDRQWRFPVCLKYSVDGDVARQCTWLEDTSARVELDGGRCPDWLMLDADFAGYYHWQIDAEGYRALSDKNAPLTEVEWQSVADSVSANLADGSLSVADAWAAVAPLAASPFPAVAEAPTRLLEYLFEHYGDEPKIAATLRTYAQELYGARHAERALDPKFLQSLSSAREKLFYAELLRFMALVAGDPVARTAAYERVSEALTDSGIDTSAMATLTLQSALSVAVQDGDEEVRETLLAAFLASRDSQFRRTALEALAVSRDPAFATRMREMTLTDGLRSNEVARLLYAQFKDRNVRPGAWRWLQANWEQLAPRMPVRNAARAPSMAARFCDEEMAARTGALFAHSSRHFPGGERALDKARETIVNCARRVAHERAGARSAFAPGMRR